MYIIIVNIIINLKFTIINSLISPYISADSKKIFFVKHKTFIKKVVNI